MAEPTDETDVTWEEEESAYYSIGVLLSASTVIRVAGWIFTVAGIAALFLSIGRYMDIRAFDFLAGLLIQSGIFLVVGGVTWIILGHLIGCFVAIEQNTRRNDGAGGEAAADER